METVGQPAAPESGCGAAGDLSETRQPAVSISLGKFDFWVLLGSEIGAFAAMYVSTYQAVPRNFAFRYFLASTLFACVTAAIGVKAPSRAGFKILPIIESWRTGTLRLRAAAYPVAVSAATGITACYAAFVYQHFLYALNKSLGRTPSRHHFSTGVVDIVCSAIVEEIVFRLVLFALLAVLMDWIWRQLTSRETVAAVWIANLLQALAFGAAHVAVGMGGLEGRPWYIRIPFVSQTWSGLILGCVYWKYGTESAITCHATFDLFALAVRRKIIHRPHL
jgi:membrane protease YdiL (CAAX protease family)